MSRYLPMGKSARPSLVILVNSVPRALVRAHSNGKRFPDNATCCRRGAIRLYFRAAQPASLMTLFASCRVGVAPHTGTCSAHVQGRQVAERSWKAKTIEEIPRKRA
jgi:hypothetical protein